MKYKKSIITDDLKHCYICGSTSNIHIHHIYKSYRRKKSTEYGLVVPLCFEHHEGTYGVHGKHGHELDMRLKKEGQAVFEKAYPELEFITIFGRNYL